MFDCVPKNASVACKEKRNKLSDMILYNFV